MCEYTGLLDKQWQQDKERSLKIETELKALQEKDKERLDRKNKPCIVQ